MITKLVLKIRHYVGRADPHSFIRHYYYPRNSSCLLTFHTTTTTVETTQCAPRPPFPHMLSNDMSDDKADDRPAETIQSPPYLVLPSNVPDEEQPLLYGQHHESQRTLTNINITIVIACIACTTAISGVNAGMVTVAIPQIALDLNLDASQALWYVSSIEAKPNSVLDYKWQLKGFEKAGRLQVC